jgi:hypothetical protein
MAVDMTMDAAESRRSLERIWALWRELPGTLLVPGHDLTMRLDEAGRPEYLGEPAPASPLGSPRTCW